MSIEIAIVESIYANATVTRQLALRASRTAAAIAMRSGADADYAAVAEAEADYAAADAALDAARAALDAASAGARESARADRREAGVEMRQVAR